MPIGGTEGMVDILEGTVTEVAGHEIYLSRSELFDVDRKGQDWRTASGQERNQATLREVPTRPWTC